MPKLTALAVKRAEKPGLVGDGLGLWLQVRSAENKSWLFRYRMAGRQRAMGLGPVHLISLSDAREMARDAGKLVRQGVDPIEQRRQSRVDAAGAGMTFRKAAEACIASREGEWRNLKHRGQWSATLEAYVYPMIGDRDVGLVTTDDIRRTLDPIWSTKTETASRVRARMKAVLDYAEAAGWRKGENPARWRDHLQKLFSAPSKVTRVQHHAALPWAHMAGFMAELRAETGVAARALELVILTAARSGEAIEARWSEIDLDARIWTVPAERMKAGRSHRVPLSDAAMAVVKGMALRRTDAGFLFPGAKANRPLSNMAMTATLRRMKHGDITVHGFRSSFRDWCSEATDCSRDVAEAALAHALPNNVEAAYRRGDLLAKRATLMEEWATSARVLHHRL